MVDLKTRETFKDLLILQDSAPREVIEYLKNIYYLYPWRREPAFVTSDASKNGESSDIRRGEYIRITKDEKDFQDIFQNMEAKMFELNNAHYQFDLFGIIEDIKVIHYSPGDYFEWHYDMMGTHTSTRKLNFSLQLSDSHEYEGGDLEFFLFDTKTNPFARNAGTMICYPAYLPHRATKVISGERLVLVGHVSGNVFR